MVFGSALCMIVVSLLTAPPSAETITKYFPGRMSESSGQGAETDQAFEQLAARGR
jgi:hypothetical protein